MLIDSNILIYSLNNDSPKQLFAQEFLQSQKQFFVAQQNIFETFRVLTHTRLPNHFSPREALSAVKKITSHATVISPTFDTTHLALELIKKYQISGTEVFDAYLIATALSNNITNIATDNEKHFRKYQEIEIVNPFRTTLSN